MKEFKGLYPAIVTPFTDNGKINEHSIELMIKQGYEQGASGFFICGSTGEALLLSMDERKYALEAAIAASAGKGDIIANIGCMSTEESIELATHAQKSGAAAIASVPPFYYRFSLSEYCRYYAELTGAVSIPAFVYLIPSHSNVSFTYGDFEELFGNDRLIGAKMTTTDLFLLQRLIKKYPNHSFFSGLDELYLSAVAVGCKAAVGSTLSLMLEKYLAISRCCEKGDLQTAQTIQDEINQVIAVLLEIGVIRGVKALTEMQGIPCGDCRKPFSPITREQRNRLKDILHLLQ